MDLFFLNYFRKKLEYFNYFRKKLEKKLELTLKRLCFAEAAHDGLGERAGCRHHGPRDGALHQR